VPAFFRFALWFAVLVVIGYATRMYTLPWVGAWLDVGQRPQPTDYVMVLNGERETRPFAAADLYQRGLAKHILITSTRVKKRRTARPVPHEAVRSILIRCGVDESAIEFIDSRCSSTFDEAETLKQFLSSRPGVTVSVITNEFHTRRARWAFRNVLGPQMSEVRFVSARTDHFNPSNWWKHEEGFVWYLSEFLKFSFYWFRYGHGFAWVTAVFGIFVVGWHLRRRVLTNTASNR
jgi:uncharacterized SAM-binding protein YcdF (DUF218 family)